MNRIKLISIILSCGLILSGCSSQENTSLGTSDNDTNTQLSNDDTSKVLEETTQDVTTVQETTSIEVTKDTSETVDNTSISDETSTDTDSSSTTSSESTINYDDLVIPITSHSDYITKDMCKEVAEYFNSMKNVDVDTFKSKQLTSYNTFMEEYLAENDSSIEDMLSTYNSNILLSSGQEGVEYNSYTFNNIRLEYPNDVDSILNTITYIEQMDEITTKYDNYTLSEELTAYYQLNYTINYTLHGENIQDYNSTNNGSILLMDIKGIFYLVMLY